MAESLLVGKRVLIVDDEPDVLETLTELLSMCDLVSAASFEEAKALLEAQHFDVAILDIMGVRGYDLLKVANEHEVIGVMLTAHALSPEDLIKSHREGAASYLPKDKMSDIVSFLEDILDAKEKGRSPWERSMDRLASFFNRNFGQGWQKVDQEFWDEFKFTMD